MRDDEAKTADQASDTAAPPISEYVRQRRAHERMLSMVRQAAEAAARVGASWHDARAAVAENADEQPEPLPNETCAFPASDQPARG